MVLVLKKSENLPEYIVRFCRFLRKHRFQTGVAEEMELLQVLCIYVPNTVREFKNLLKVMLVKNHAQIRMFDELFNKYWSEILIAENSKIRQTERENSRTATTPVRSKPPTLYELKNWLYAGRKTDKVTAYTYSDFEILTIQDFSHFNDTEIQSIQDIIQSLAAKARLKKSRRFKSTNSKNQIDYRGTIRRAMRKNLEIEKIHFKKQKHKKFRLVILCDVSRSMELYSRFLIGFLYSMNQTKIDLESFVFSTSLTHISPIIRNRDLEHVLNSLSEKVDHWAGGTRLGHCFSDFKNSYGRRYLHGDTWLIILSDGIDTGNISKLEKAMKFFRKKAARIIWLNPLAGNPNYKPTAKGMSAALPYVDVFAPVHNLQTFRKAMSDIIALQ